MLPSRPLPAYLVNRYRGWKATKFEDNKSWYHHLAHDGQHPRAMVISCCDSRVSPPEIFEADPGEFFLHRNIASLVPPLDKAGKHHCTGAAVEYAVGVLHVAHLIVIGHSGCGGVKGCHDMCAGEAPALEDPDSTVGRWLDILRPGYERTEGIAPTDARLAAMERAGVVIALENLLSYPAVRNAVESDRLTLHGVWNDIASGALEQFDPATGNFVPV